MDLREAQPLWDARPGWLDTASFGLPPRPAWEELQAALDEWRQGLCSWHGWDESTHRARAAFARLVHADPSHVAVGSTVSGLLSLVAAALPSGTRVLVPEMEFTSNLFPWLVHEDRGVTVRAVPLDELADAVDSRTDLVAYSLVQSASGAVAAHQAIVAAARDHDALVCVDATQACGWLPFDAREVDVVACSAYKWLMAPRGVAFGYFREDVWDLLRPLQAGWYAGDDAHDSYYGTPLRLAKSARRFDISPAWFSFVGAAPALETLERVGVDAVYEHNVALANRFRSGLGLPPGDSAIVSVDVPDAEEKLRAAGVRTGVRAGRVRASFHLYTTDRDVDTALEALSG